MIIKQRKKREGTTRQKRRLKKQNSTRDEFARPVVFLPMFESAGGQFSKLRSPNTRARCASTFPFQRCCWSFTRLTTLATVG